MTDHNWARPVLAGLVLVVLATVLVLSRSRQEIADIDGWPVHPKCQGSSDFDICVLFTEQCSGCHGTLAALNLEGPDLVSLIGRKRTFTSGESIVADDAYIRRSILDHGDEAERIPGYYTSKTQLRRLADDAPDAEKAAALARYIVDMEPYPLAADVRVEQDWVSKDSRVESIERLMQIASETIRSCYQVALIDRPDVRGAFLVEFRADQGSRVHGEIVESDVSNAIIAGCVANSVSAYAHRDAAAGPALARYTITVSARPTP